MLGLMIAAQMTSLATVPVELMVTREVTAESAKPGQLVKLVLNKSVPIEGRPAIPSGTPAFGEVVAVDPSGLAMKRGSLAIRLTRMVIDGSDVPLLGELSTKGRGGKNDDAVKVMLAPIYAPFAHGNSAKFKAGEIVTGRLDVSQLSAGAAAIHPVR